MFEITIANANDRNRQTELSLPTTANQVREAFGRIDLDWNGQHEYVIAGHRMTPDGLMECLQPGNSIDELNYLADRLTGLDDTERDKLTAILDGGGKVAAAKIIDTTYNLDYYVHIPEVANFEELGRYYLYQSGMVEMPEDWKTAIPLEAFGQNAAEKEGGRFTDHGYIVKSGDKWLQRYNGMNIPEKYRVTLYPNQPETHFSIYQVKLGDERGILWVPYDALVALNRMPRLDDYQLVYSGVVYPGETMETISQKFRVNRPDDFTGNSLSVSDVIVVDKDGYSTAYYIDRTGFKELDGFLPKEQERDKPPKEKQQHRDYGPEL